MNNKEIKNNYCVYKHTLPDGKYYIGMCVQPVHRRWKKGMGYKNQKEFFEQIVKYGWNNIKHDIISDNLTKEEATKIENDLITLAKKNDKDNCYNKSYGYGRKGVHTKQSKESNIKRSQSSIGVNRDMNKILVVDGNNVKNIYKNQQEASRATGVKQPNISKFLNSGYDCSGFRFYSLVRDEVDLNKTRTYVSRKNLKLIKKMEKFISK